MLVRQLALVVVIARVRSGPNVIRGLYFTVALRHRVALFKNLAHVHHFCSQISFHMGGGGLVRFQSG